MVTLFHDHQKYQQVIVGILTSVVVLVCALTLLESNSTEVASYHGADFSTIAGTKSTTEVFQQGGVYVLHNYSALVPECTRCNITENHQNVGSTHLVQVHDFFDRALTKPSIAPSAEIVVTAVPPAPMKILRGTNTSPTPPPPQRQM